MTVHTAKGLEFPVVFLTGLEERIFPHARSVDDDSAVEEERRLCYVAVTRARRQLYLSRVRRRRLSGQELPGVPSRFLRDLPPDGIEAIVMARPAEYAATSTARGAARGAAAGRATRTRRPRLAPRAARRRASAARAPPARRQRPARSASTTTRTTRAGRAAGGREAAPPVVRRRRGPRLAGRGRRPEGDDALPQRRA